MCALFVLLLKTDDLPWPYFDSPSCLVQIKALTVLLFVHILVNVNAWRSLLLKLN